MAKFPDAEKRMFKDVYVCYKCKSKIRASYEKVKKKVVKCRRCDGKSFRPKNKTRAKG